MEKNLKNNSKGFLRKLGVFGFDEVEPIILAALVSEDPILLIGEAGTGKTFLLNSISEAMRLEHRHYNASLISFDDLIGFPAPSADGNSIRFLQSPATVWGAESVLVDELSRCKPENQNKFFSIVHERKIQGIPLENLSYRWAAMNPFHIDGGDDHYEGSQALDQALADRFAFIIEVPDWPNLKKDEQLGVIDPAGENAISNDDGGLYQFVSKLKPVFNKAIQNPDKLAVDYVRLATTFMHEAGMRFSPRRARLLARNITAARCVVTELNGEPNDKQLLKLFKLVLNWSVPHRAYRENVAQHQIDTVHAEASRLVLAGDESQSWTAEFIKSESMATCIDMLFDPNIDRDVKSVAVIQKLMSNDHEKRAIFCFSAYPAVSSRSLLTEDALCDMLNVTSEILEVNGELKWKELVNQEITSDKHPIWAECQKLINSFPSKNKLRKQRAKQIILYLLLKFETVSDPETVEQELNQCFERVTQYLKKTNS
ncbi:MAG: AAA family ATPase [Bacteroidota bacterium]